MTHKIQLLLSISAGSAFVSLALAATLSVAGRLGSAGRRFVDACAKAPVLDLLISLFTWIPWVTSAILAGWMGIGAALVGQAVTLLVWTAAHELAFRHLTRGFRIGRFISRTVGTWQNHLALWVTLIALPGFLFVRALELICWPMLVGLLNFPRYKSAEWINVSRHKFEGLVGHDLIWCLYCDWMTGVFSLAAEMLRNVESFWCPIRFYDGKKCENCRVDFPDIDNGWTPANGNMEDVGAVMGKQYTARRREWFGHAARLTVNGKPTDSAPKPPPV